MSVLPLLLAQWEPAAADRSGFQWTHLFNPAVVWVFIPIVAILVGGVVKILQRTQQHRERMAMIAAGLHPDFPPQDDPFDEHGGHVLDDSKA